MKKCNLPSFILKRVEEHAQLDAVKCSEVQTSSPDTEALPLSSPPSVVKRADTFHWTPGTMLKPWNVKDMSVSAQGDDIDVFISSL